MEDGLTPDDTLPDEAYADTIAELAALADMTLPDFPMPRSVAQRKAALAAQEEE